jgi:probable addiction module antidote protein
MKNQFRSFDQLLEEYLQNPDFALSFLNQALADEDIEAFSLSLKDIIRVHGNITGLAKEAHLSRGTLYKLMAGKGQTEIGTILKLMHALGYSLSVTRRENAA